jgi:soluble lytic murein transglycosylase
MDAEWRALSDLNEKNLNRLRFLIVNDLPEAKLEIQYITSTMSDADVHYALALVLFQIEEYYDSVRIASCASDSFRGASLPDNVLYLLYPTAYRGLINTSAVKYQLDPLLTLAVMREESHFLQDSLSSSEACGLMQILPKTGKWLAKQALGSAALERSDLFLPSTNIELGSCYLRYLLDKFDNNLLVSIAAYNWGETNMRKWLQNAPKEDVDIFVETLPSDETKRYIKKVFKSYSMYRSLYPDDWNTDREKS